MAVIIDALGILIGGYFGAKAGGRISLDIHREIMKYLGICTIIIGITSALLGDMIIMLSSIVIGVLFGTRLGLDRGLNNFALKMENKYVKGKDSNLAEGFVTGTLLFCIGSMSIIGSIEAGIRGNNEILLAKAMLDLISGFFLAASLGIGISVSSISVLIYEGAIFILASLVAPIMTEEIINNISGTGGIIIIAIGLNMIGLTDIKLANSLPAILVPIIVGIFKIII